MCKTSLHNVLCDVTACVPQVDKACAHSALAKCSHLL
jgi:hypothetical protein